MKTLILKRQPNLQSGHADFHVLDNGQYVGRIYSGTGARGDKWMWALNGIGSELADTLDEAKQRLKARYISAT